MQQLSSLGNEGVLVLVAIESLIWDWRPPFTVITLFCLYCFVKGVSLLSSWVTGEGLSKNNLPLPGAPFCSTVYWEQSDSSRNSQLAGEDESENLQLTPDKNCGSLDKIKEQHCFLRKLWITWRSWGNWIFFPALAPFHYFQRSLKQRLVGSTQEQFGRKDACWQWVSGRFKGRV